jgi:NAD-dependent SIR2 family protein deacetylase
MKLNELKSELKEKEKGCNCENNYKTGDKLKVCGKNWYCPTCQAKIEYLKKGISAYEEILNSQQIQKDNSEGSNTDYLETQSTTEEVKKHEFKSGCVDNQSADTSTHSQGHRTLQEGSDTSPVQTLIKTKTIML